MIRSLAEALIYLRGLELIMGEAAVKEPSMEDILSSIRKIIAEEGGAEPAAQAAPEVEALTSPEAALHTSEVDVAGDISATADELPATEAIATDVQSFEGEAQPHNEADFAHTDEVSVETTVTPEYAQPTMEEAAPAQAGSSMSLASIAASLRSSPETEQPAPVAATPVAPEVIAPTEPEPSMQTETFETSSMEETHVEMAEATPPPATATFEDQPVGVPAPTASDMAREEEAFRGALMSPSADGAVSSSFDRLKRSAMDDLDAKTEAILRPMLREWLDENLPSMVERLVREEIERVARG